MKKYILTAVLAVVGLLGALHAAQPTAPVASCCAGGQWHRGGWRVGRSGEGVR